MECQGTYTIMLPRWCFNGLCSLELGTSNRLMEDRMLFQETQEAGHIWGYLVTQYLRDF